MPCSACAKRRKKLEALKAKKNARGQTVQAAAITATLAVTQAVGNALGIKGEEDGAIGPNEGGPSDARPASGDGSASRA